MTVRFRVERFDEFRACLGSDDTIFLEVVRAFKFSNCPLCPRSDLTICDDTEFALNGRDIRTLRTVF